MSEQSFRISVEQQPYPPVSVCTTFRYKMACLQALKIVALINYSRLNYVVEVLIDGEVFDFVLQTPFGELKQQYEIVNYILYECKRLAPYQPKKCKKLIDASESVVSEPNESVNSLSGHDNYHFAQMTEQLYRLRLSLFLPLQEFYQYLFGNVKVRKSKYEAARHKIKKEINKLECKMNQHFNIFDNEFDFLKITIVCELRIACIFLFEERFRNSKRNLFKMCQTYYRSQQFIRAFGKTQFCNKELIPAQFEMEQEIQPKRSDELIPIEVVKMAQSISCGESPRNELMYNYFQGLFHKQQFTSDYLPYFWLMFDKLNLTLIEVKWGGPCQYSQSELFKKSQLIESALRQVTLQNVDYGFVCVYEDDKNYELKGLMFIGSKGMEEFEKSLSILVEPIEIVLKAIDVSKEEEQSLVEEYLELFNQHNSCNKFCF